MTSSNIRKYSFDAEQYHPYNLTLDFKCLLKKMQKQITKTTKYILKHIANNSCFYSDEMRSQLVKCNNPEKLTGKFNELLQNHKKRYNKLRMKNEKMIWEEEEANKFLSAIFLVK